MGFSHGLPTTRSKCVTDSNLFSEAGKSANVKQHCESASEDSESRQIISSTDNFFCLGTPEAPWPSVKYLVISQLHV